MTKIFLLLTVLMTSAFAQDKGGEVGNPVLVQKTIVYELGGPVADGTDPVYVDKFCDNSITKDAFYSLYLQSNSAHKGSDKKRDNTTKYFKTVNNDVTKYIEQSCKGFKNNTFERTNAILQACKKSCKSHAAEFGTTTLLLTNSEKDLNGNCDATCNQVMVVQRAYLAGFVDRHESTPVNKEKEPGCKKDSIVDLSRQSKEIIEKVQPQEQKSNSVKER